jgi:hypothetical protein
MNAALFAVLLAAAPSAGAESIVRDLIENDHQRVGVLPAVICRSGDHQSTVGSLGPRGKLLAKELQRELFAVSQRTAYREKFSVLEEDAMLRAMRARGFGVGDLGDSRKIRDLARDVGADAIVTLTYDEQARPPASVLMNSETLDASDGAITASHNIPDELTLSKAAYQGESWELRRWVRGRLENRGIDMEGSRPFGRGPKWEKTHYVHLKDTLVHPIEIEDFPYVMSIQVDGKLRLPESVERNGRRHYLVELNEGETYGVRLENYSDQPVYVALLIDGKSSIDEVMREPADLETGRHWHVSPNRVGKTAAVIDAWYNIRRDHTGRPIDQRQEGNEFKIVRAEKTTSFGAGFGDRIGTITAIFYTVGMAGIEQPDPKLTPRAFPNSAFGTGLGKRKEVALEFKSRPTRGLILASWTFHYRSRQEIDDLHKGISNDPINYIAAPSPPRAVNSPAWISEKW